jgi:hypothetical protein
MQFVCFSSGAQRQYRDDIVRALGMPFGCELIFRYRLKYVAESVQNYLKNDRVRQGDRVLISYVDQSERNQPVFFIPVRFATMIETSTIGDFVVLRMRVGNFAHTSDLDAFSRELQASSEGVPKWSADSTSKYAVGAFWVEVKDYPPSVIESTCVVNWQTTVGQLLKRKDFAESGPFYQVVSLETIKTRQPVEMISGEFTLAPNTEYQLMVDHFLSRQDAGAFQLEVLVSGQPLMVISGSKMHINSPYDRHWLRFKTQEPVRDERAVMTLTKKATGEDPAVQFDLPIRVKGRRWKAVLVGLVVGAFLAVPQITTTWINPDFANRGLAWLFALAGFIIVFNVAVGIAAALNFRKPIG